MKYVLRYFGSRRLNLIDGMAMVLGCRVWDDHGILAGAIVFVLGGAVAKLVEMISDAHAR